MNPLLTSNSTTPVNLGSIFQTNNIMPESALTPSFIYAVGSVHPDFPSLSVEKEFMQSLSTDDMKQLKANGAAKNILSIDKLAPFFYSVLNEPTNFHLAREMQWKFTNVDNNPLFTIIPGSNARLQELINATQCDASTKQPKLELLLGRQKDHGHMLMTKLTSISQSQLQNRVLAKDASITVSQLTAIMDIILSLQANNGQSIKARALNYALYNNPSIYSKSYDLLYGSASAGANPSGYQLLGINTRQQDYQGGHQVDIIFNYAGINSGAPQSWYCSVDVSGEFPYLLREFSRFLPSK